MPVAIVISNLPIMVATANSVLGDRYRVVSRTWTTCHDEHPVVADLVIMDVTLTVRDAALSLLGKVVCAAQVLVCSVHQNEVEVYHCRQGGMEPADALPSLLAFTH